MPKKLITTNRGIQVGKGANTLLNLLIGANDALSYKGELEKIEYLQTNSEQIDLLTDLSLYDNNVSLWEHILNNTSYMVGTVPVYLVCNENGCIEENRLYELVCEQCEKGVSVITIHPTVNFKLLETCKERLIPCTSRGGGIVARDLLINKREENIYIKLLDRIAKECKKHKTILSIGSSFRSGTIIDALDQTYYLELEEQLSIANYLEEMGVESIIETPGHIDADKLLKLCEKLRNIKYPIMPLGPMLTDIGFEEDDTVAVIGATLMGVNGCADILSVVTSREHLSGIPNIEEVKSAISKYKVAKHIIDLYKTHDDKGDKRVSEERAKIRSCNVCSESTCERCGEACPLRIITSPE